MDKIKKQRRVKQFRLLVTAMAGLLSVICGGVAAHHCCGVPCWAQEVGRVAASLATIALAWVLIAVLYGFIKRSSFVIWGFAAIYCVGVLTYHEIEKHPCGEEMAHGVSILAPINNTLSIFFPSRGAYSEENHSEVHLDYQVVHLLSYFFFALVMFSFFGRRALNRSGQRLIPYRHRNIFWGYDENGQALGEDILARTVDDQVLFILPEQLRDDEDEDNRIFNNINRMDAVALYADYDKRTKLGRSRSGYRHFFLTEDQDFNVRMALRVLDGLIAQGVPMKTHLYVRSEMEGVDVFFQNRMKMLDEEGKKRIEVHLYNHSDLTARQFVAQYPVLAHPSMTIDTATCEVKGEMNILLLGLGWSGLELLKKMVCDAQFLGNDYRFSVTVIDRDYATKHGRYKYHFAELIEGNHFDLRFNPEGITEANGVAFYDWLAGGQRITTFDRIIVALGNDGLNVNTALELNKFRLNYYNGNPDMLKERIFAHVRNYDTFAYYQDEKSPIALFGGLRSTNSMRVLIDEEMDRIAKMVNYVYSRWDKDQFEAAEFARIVAQWESIEEAWAKATIFDQDSSRAVSLNIHNVIRLAGGEAAFISRLAECDYVERFAELEHLRWNAFHYVNGIRRWPFEEVNNRKGKLIENGTLLKHVCLVPYADLNKASDRVNFFRSLSDTQENFKASDRRIVAHFPLFLQHK